MPTRKSFTAADAALRKHAMSYPETVEHFPWEHSAFKVKGKVYLFTFIDEDKDHFSLSVKLPVSGKTALTLPFTSPTGYGLGKSGWVTAQFTSKDTILLDMLLEWVDESFRAIAPKRVLAQMEETPAEPKRHKKRK